MTASKTNAKTLGLAATLVAVWAGLTGGVARADDCGNIAETGLCQDPKTLVYCARGELQTMTCGPGEICVTHEFFDGSAGCVGTRYTGCGDITESGRCVSDALLLYCDNDRVVERTCDDGWVCGLVDAGADADDYHDCIAAALATTPDNEGGDAGPVAPAEAPAEADVEGDAEPNFEYQPDTIAAPSVERGGAKAAGEYSAGGDGTCAGGAGGSGLGLVLALAGLVVVGVSRRTRRDQRAS